MVHLWFSHGFSLGSVVLSSCILVWVFSLLLLLGAFPWYECFNLRLYTLELKGIWIGPHLSSYKNCISWLVSKNLWGYKFGFYFGYPWVESLGHVETCHTISHLRWCGTLTHLSSGWEFRFLRSLWLSIVIFDDSNSGDCSAIFLK